MVLISFQEPNTPYPTIVYTVTGEDIFNPADVRLMMDGIKIVADDEAMDFTFALQCLVAAYYMYNVNYAKGAAKTLKFVEHYILNIPKQTPPSTTVIRVHNMLSSQSQNL